MPRDRMFRPLLLSGLLVMVAVGGCLGGDDEGSPTTSGTSPAPGPDTSYRVVVRNHTSEARVGEPLNVTWDVMPALDDENATNQSIMVRHTTIHWGNESVSDPRSMPSPGGSVPTSPTSSLTTSPTVSSSPFAAAMTTHATTSTTTSTSTTTTGPASNTSDAASDYPNETQEQNGPPGTYNESIVVESSGVLYLRAHAIIGNSSFWSDEVVVNVTANATLPLGTQHVVQIGEATPGPLSNYDPNPLNIKVGDSVVWKNVDALSLSHTATSTAGNPSFDTGSLAKNQFSKPVFFNATGTWTYGCDVHPSTMEGATIVVT